MSSSKIKPGKNVILRPNGSKRVFHHFADPSKADQSAAKECDVNHIVAKFTKTGQISHLQRHQGVFADLTEVTDLLSMTLSVQNAQYAFNQLPAILREKLNNDPSNLVPYLQDPENDDELMALGIKTRPTTSVSKPPVGVTTQKNKKPKQLDLSNDDDSNDDDLDRALKK